VFAGVRLGSFAEMGAQLRDFRFGPVSGRGARGVVSLPQAVAGTAPTGEPAVHQRRDTLGSQRRARPLVRSSS
jgi:hypothetical protein